MKIKIIIPKQPKRDKWFVTVSGVRFTRSSVTSAYRFVEGKVSSFLRSSVGQKLTIVVDYDQLHGLATTKELKWFNDITSNSKNELLYAFTCFLEDHLTTNYAKEKYKQYGGFK